MDVGSAPATASKLHFLQCSLVPAPGRHPSFFLPSCIILSPNWRIGLVWLVTKTKWHVNWEVLGFGNHPRKSSKTFSITTYSLCGIRNSKTSWILVHGPICSHNRNETLTARCSRGAKTVQFHYGFRLERLAFQNLTLQYNYCLADECGEDYQHYCFHGGHCCSLNDNPFCVCEEGWTGRRCELMDHIYIHSTSKPKD